MTEELQRVLLCPPWEDRDVLVQGGMGFCSCCGREVAVARSSAEVLLLGAEILCHSCGAVKVFGWQMDGEDVHFRRAWVPEEVE